MIGVVVSVWFRFCCFMFDRLMCLIWLLVWVFVKVEIDVLIGVFGLMWCS